MASLNTNWLTDGLIDFEYKKYILLSYFKEVRESFHKIELYPFMADLVFHYNNLIAFKENKTIIKDSFPNRLRKFDFEKLKAIYQRMIEDDDVMKEIEDIIHFAEPKFKESLEEGKEIYEFVEKNCELSPIGLMPLYVSEGYFFIEQPKSDTSIFRYQVTMFENSSEKLRGVHALFIDSIKKGVGDSYENVKLNLTKRIKDLPNPAVFLVSTKIKFPQSSTLLPIIKRLLVRYVSTT